MAENLKPEIRNNKILAGNKIKSIYTPVKATDVLSRLKKFEFGLLDRVRYVEVSGGHSKFYSCLDESPDSDIPVILDSTGKQSLILSSMDSDNSFDQETTNFVNQCYNKIFGDNPMIESEVVFYNSAREYFDISSEIKQFELIGTSETYTNIVDIGEVVHLISDPGSVCFASLNIRVSSDSYPLQNFGPDGVIFPLFSYNSDGTLNIQDTRRELEVYQVAIILDSKKYTLEVIPIDPNSINECIISKCTINYGKYY